MASTSDNLKIVLLAKGDEGYGSFNNYGDVQNANWEIVEAALSETSDITIDTANVTLTDAQQQSLCLKLTGTLTANRDLILKADQKGFWMVYNNTSGAYTVTIKPSGGSGFELDQGAWSIVVSDGETASLIVTSSVGDVVGDFKSTPRTLSSDWLRRDGSLYDAADYPDLAAILPELPDGVSWDTESPNTSANKVISIVQVGTRLTATFSNDVDTVVMASLDGAEWNVRATVEGLASPSLAYGLGIYVAVDGNGKYSLSNDGDSWSTPAAVDSGTLGFTDIAFGAGVFVAVGVADGVAAIYTTDDGTTWTERSTGSSGLFRGVDFVNDVFIVTGSNGEIFTSTDGATWTSRTSGTTDDLYAAGYADGTYVVVGEGGTIKTSTNLSAWTSRTSGVSTTLRAVIGSSLGFLVVGASGVARISSNGTTWTAAPTGLTSTLTFAIVDSEDDTRYYVVGNMTSILYGVRTLPTQFRVPDDDPTYGWIKALA